MEKSLKGVLAHYGVEEVIARLKGLLEFTVFDPDGDVTTELKTTIEQHSNDAEFIADIMESFPVQNEDGSLATLNTSAEWEFPQDETDFEAEADKLIIAQAL